MRLIHIQPCDLWDYFKSHAIQLEQKPVVCATSGEMEIWLSNDDGIMSFTVFENDIELASFEIFDQDDIPEQYVRALMMLGFDEDEICDDGDGGFAFENDDAETDDDSETDDEKQDLIFEREEELETILTNTIYDVLGDDGDNVSEKDITEATMLLKEVVCDLLAKKYGMPIYRPMWLVDEDGTKFFEEYPYPSIIEDSTA